MAKSTQAARRYYVYQLIDPRSGWPFYVGKGTGARTWHHLTVDKDTVDELLRGEVDRAAAALDAKESEDAATELDSRREDRESVRQRVAAIRASGLKPGVEWLIKEDGADMDERTAFATEAALIESLRRLPLPDEHKILNRAAGHHYRWGAHASLNAAAQAEEVVLPSHRNFVIVASKGVWGGLDSTGQFAGASREVAWENAHEVWSIGRKAFDYVNKAGSSESPVILLGLAEDPLKKHSNIVVCVEELSGAVALELDDATRPGFANKKRFTRPRQEQPATTALREQLIGNAPMLVARTPSSRPEPARPNVGVVYIGPWHEAVV